MWQQLRTDQKKQQRLCIVNKDNKNPKLRSNSSVICTEKGIWDTDTGCWVQNEISNVRLHSSNIRVIKIQI